MKAMPYADAVTILEDLAADVAANPQPDFARVLRWWEHVDQVTRMLDGRISSIGIEREALSRLRSAVAGAATRTTKYGAPVDPNAIRAPALALRGLLMRLGRLSSAAA